MVDHPDFCSERELEKAKGTLRFQLQRDETDDADDEDTAGEDSRGEDARSAKATKAHDAMNPIATFNPAAQIRSLASIRSGVTVAMVAVALGFACCESNGFSPKGCLPLGSNLTFVVPASREKQTNKQARIYSIFSYTTVRASGRVRYMNPDGASPGTLFLFVRIVARQMCL